MTRSASTAATEPIFAGKIDVDEGEFVRELTELSRKYQIGISGSMTLFVMEPEDFERRYSCNEQSRLSFS